MILIYELFKALLIIYYLLLIIESRSDSSISKFNQPDCGIMKTLIVWYHYAII